MAATPQPPENKKPAATRNSTKAAGTRMGLKITRRGVAMTNPMTVPVRTNPDKSKSEMPIVAAVMNLTVWREGGLLLLLVW
uniref:Uncharacterized protein n=1 Tax=Cajanus cajan TaxID=3821 RepID=A0A151TSW3_CAJCA|nr:hypothetical protein KK1_009365 [Cajanus cajan]